MILQSRRWRLVIRLATLLVTSLLILAFAGPVSYALQDDTPTTITSSAQLLSKSLDGKYITIVATPNILGAFSTQQLITTYDWVPLNGFDGDLIVRTEDSRYLFPYDYDPVRGFVGDGEVRYTGKLIPLKNQIGADKVVEELAAQGIKVDKEKAMVLSQGEIPSSYRPMVPVIPALAWVWLAALVGLVQILRGRRPRHLERAPALT